MKRFASVLAVVTFCTVFLIPQARAKKQKPITIGAFFALSGPAAFIGTPTKLVAQMAVDEINKKQSALFSNR